MSNPLTRPLRHETFRWLWLGGVVSNLGTMVQTVGAGWLMATLVLSSDMVSFVQAATTLPVMLFSIVAGVLADSYERRKVLFVAQLLMMFASISLALTVFAGLITPTLLLMFTFLLGCGTALHTPSWQASVGDVVTRDEIPEAVTLNSMGLNMTRSAGPAIGGLIVAIVGAGAAFLFNALSFLPMLYALSRWKSTPTAQKTPREDFLPAIFSGTRYLSMSPNLLKVIFRGFLFGLSAVAVLALLPLVARDLLQGDAMTYGLLLSAYGIGALCGGWFNAWLRRRFRAEMIVRLAFAGFVVSATLIALSSNMVMTSAALLLAGACWVLALSLFNVVVQLSTPRWVVGRVLSIYQTASFGGMTLGGWLWGLIAEASGTPAALMISSVAAGVGLCVGFVLKMPDLKPIDLDPLNRFQEPAVLLDIKPRSGPVRIQVEYDIPNENVARFLENMNDRRRVRLRDGARHWVLLRDMENPHLWKETYLFLTWSDYVRCNNRPTQADSQISGLLRDLCRDQKKPVVRRMLERHRVPSEEDMAIKSNPETP